jgi:hypothetical protein
VLNVLSGFLIYIIVFCTGTTVILVYMMVLFSGWVIMLLNICVTGITDMCVVANLSSN